jgi:hypothetical protein
MMPGRTVKPRSVREHRSKTTSAITEIRRRLVRSAPWNERESNKWHRFGESDETQRERVPSQLINLPGDHDCLDLRGHGHRQQAGYEPAEVEDTEGCVGIVAEGVVHSGRKVAAICRWTKTFAGATTGSRRAIKV